MSHLKGPEQRTNSNAHALRLTPRLCGQYAYLIHMSYLRKKPPAGAPNINSGMPWTELDLQDLRYCLAAGDPPEAIADFLCRNVDEVRAKTVELAGGRS